MSQPLVTISHLSASYGAVQALDDINLEINDREFFALLGPSGCGKTTLLRTLAGFESPDTGTITLDGDDLLALPPNKRPVNMMFQSYALFGHMSVERNVGYGLARAGVPKKEASARVAEVLATVGLQHLATRRPAQLSGGQRQRVALARAIVNRPKVLLLDEPLSALDRQVRSGMQAELKRLQHEVGIAFVMVTHDQEEALSLADRVAVMDHGRVQQVATPAELYRRPVNRFVAEFVGESNLFHAAAVAAGAGLFLVRPEEIRLSTVAPDGVENSVGDGTAAVTGTVTETAFVGGSTTVTIRPDAAVTLDGRPIRARRSGAAEFGVGDTVTVGWDAGAGVALADSAQ